MQKTFTLVAFFLGIYSTVFSQHIDFQQFNFFYQESKKAFEAGDYGQMLLQLQKADSLMENHPVILYQLAIAYLLNQQDEKVCQVLMRLIRQDHSFMPEKDSNFYALPQETCFANLVRERERLSLPIANSQPLSYGLPHPDYHPECIAFSPKQKTFWTGSVRRRNIGYWDKKGQFFEYIDETQGLYAILAMKFSNDGKVLWLSTAAIPEMRGFRKDLEGKAQIIALYLNTLDIKRYEIFDNEQHLFSDFAIHPATKEVFVLDNRQSVIYRIKPNQSKMEEWLKHPSFLNLQGVDVDAKKNCLYVSDYHKGIYRIDIANKIVEKVKWLPTKEEVSILKGIDGLYFYRNSLIAIHNGTQPYKVCRYFLDKEGKWVTKVVYIDNHRPELDQPTKGVVIGRHFYYLANSPWNAYDKQGNFSPPKDSRALILKSKL